MTESNEEEGAVAEIPVAFRNLGRTLALHRDMRGMGLRETARQAGVGVSQLSKYENGHTLPRLESLEKVLTALGMTAFDFFTTMALLDLREEEIRSGTKRDSLLLSVLSSQGILGSPVSTALRRVVDDLVLLHGEIITAALLGGGKESPRE